MAIQYVDTSKWSKIRKLSLAHAWAVSLQYPKETILRLKREMREEREREEEKGYSQVLA